MKRIALVLVVLSAAVVAAGYFAFPDETAQYAGAAAGAGTRVWTNVEANPTPVAFALGTFLLTVVYHKARGKSLRESVEVAATRVTVVSAPPPTADGEASVVRRARARATRTQLMSDLVVLQNRHRKLPDEILQYEKEVCYAEQALDEAEAKLAQRQKVREAAAAKLDAARKEKAEADAEVVAIEVELKRLADVA